MSVRKRVWTTAKGEQRAAWIADFADQNGVRQIKTFKLRREAEAYSEEAGVAVRAGIHSTPSKSPTVKAACDAWLQAAALNGLEPTTIAGYRQHVNLHIAPKLGDLKLAKLTAPMVQAFVDELKATKSSILARKVLVSLKSMLRHAMTRGAVAQNVALAIKVDSSKRHKKKLEIGRDIPSADEVQHLLATVSGRLRPLLVTAIFTGLRQDGKAKYPGLHALRHFYASWCINRRQDGGLELPAKIVQARLGHSTIAMTLDTYGHLFPSGDDGSELAAAEQALFAARG